MLGVEIWSSKTSIDICKLYIDKSNLGRVNPCEISFLPLFSNFNLLTSTIIMTTSTNLLILTLIVVYRCQVLLLLTHINGNACNPLCFV